MGASGISVDFTLPDLVDTLAAEEFPLDAEQVAAVRRELDAKDAGALREAGGAAYLPLLYAAGPFEQAIDKLSAIDASGALASRIDGLAADRRPRRRPRARSRSTRASATASNTRAGSASRSTPTACAARSAAAALTASAAATSRRPAFRSIPKRWSRRSTRRPRARHGVPAAGPRSRGRRGRCAQQGWRTVAALRPRQTMPPRSAARIVWQAAKPSLSSPAGGRRWRRGAGDRSCAPRAHAVVSPELSSACGSPRAGVARTRPCDSSVEQGDAPVQTDAVGEAQRHAVSGDDEAVTQVEQAALPRQIVHAARGVVPACAAGDREADQAGAASAGSYAISHGQRRQLESATAAPCATAAGSLPQAFLAPPFFVSDDMRQGCVEEEHLLGRPGEHQAAANVADAERGKAYPPDASRPPCSQEASSRRTRFRPWKNN